MPKDLNPANYPSEKDAEDLIDDGSTPSEEEEQEEEEQPVKKDPPAKKPAKKEEDSEEEEDSGERKPHMVPLSALKKEQRRAAEAVRKAKEAQERLEAFEREKSDRQKADFEKVDKELAKLYDDVEEARAEGRTKDAAKLQREIDRINGELTRAQAAWLASKEAVKQQNLLAYNSLVKVLEEADPRFDENADEYDGDLVDRVAELTEAFEAKGLAAPEALRKATKLILGEDPFRANRPLARDDKKAAAKPEKKGRKTDVAKNLSAQKKQPAEEPADHKEKNSTIDPTKLTDDDWDKLPESKKRELRGDFG